MMLALVSAIASAMGNVTLAMAVVHSLVGTGQLVVVVLSVLVTVVLLFQQRGADGHQCESEHDEVSHGNYYFSGFL